jgi:hypothetical protein
VVVVLEVVAPSAPVVVSVVVVAELVPSSTVTVSAGAGVA